MKITPGTLKDLVVAGVDGKLAANTAFTSYDIWKQINDVWPSLDIQDYDVRPLVRDYMESKEILNGVYDVNGSEWGRETRTYSGNQALTWYPEPAPVDRFGNVPPQAIAAAQAPVQTRTWTAQPEPDIDVDVIVSFVIRSRK